MYLILQKYNHLDWLSRDLSLGHDNQIWNRRMASYYSQGFYG